MAAERGRILQVMERMVIQENGCCTWSGFKDRLGYGQVRYQGKQWRVHRLLYEYFVGPVPEGLELDHLCRNPSCGNFAHLEAVTRQVNTLRGEGPAAKHAAKTHCKNGHPLSGENLRTVKNGWRVCRACAFAVHDRRQDQLRIERGYPADYCSRGHQVTAENSYLRYDGAIRCLKCQLFWGSGAKWRQRSS